MNLFDFDNAMVMPLIPVLVFVVGLIAWALIDIARSPAVVRLPKWTWVLVVVFAIPAGAIAYFMLGRTRQQALRDEDLR
ncbi:PLDc N-terminal domain-containing protein [Humidisolicoccus flavus]|uniref:PLDc N-terminal domain-containing protein n=1 Tax=Humidisolicoccus flavus TaxID=3111414 RepID=UPI00324D71DE